MNMLSCGNRLGGCCMSSFPDKREIVRDWLPRYTGMRLEDFGPWVLLTNFQSHVNAFAAMHDMPLRGVGGARHG